MSQDSTRRGSRRNSRAALIMLALLLIVAAAAAVASHWVLQSSQKRMLREMEQGHEHPGQGNKVALLTGSVRHAQRTDRGFCKP